MKTIRLLSLVTLALLFTSQAFAQRRGPSEEEIEKWRAKKIAFLTDKLQLTPEEAEKFWPVYNQAEQENWEAQRQRREIEEKVQREDGNLSDKEIITLTKERVGTYKTEAEIIDKYNKKFLEVLPPKKVLILYQAEHQYMRSLLRDFRDRRRDEESND
ncbi:MAG: hypothetical protein JXR31_08875 [Prolixibacteraceae bacterium]|nr:hypothetical protein [Prolixibacteraceae bacterium]